MDEQNEICEGYTDKMLQCYLYLQLPETKKQFMVPFDMLAWIWFLAYVVNFNHHADRDYFLRVPRSTVFPDLKRRYNDFQRIVDNYSHEMYENGRPFELKYSKEKGFHLLTSTTVWDFVVKGVTGLCFSVPKEIAAVLDSKGLFYFHEEGIIVGPMAFVNHECDCDVSYGFDWPVADYKRSTCAAFKKIRVVPVYLSWDYALLDVNLKQRRFIPEKTEIVIKYFDSSPDTNADNINTWFGECLCQPCQMVSILNGSTTVKQKNIQELLNSNFVPTTRARHHIYHEIMSKKQRTSLETSIFIEKLPSFTCVHSRRGIKAKRRIKSNTSNRVYIKKPSAQFKSQLLLNMS